MLSSEQRVLSLVPASVWIVEGLSECGTGFPSSERFGENGGFVLQPEWIGISLAHVLLQWTH